MTTTRLVVVALAALVAGSSSSRANLLVNGDFETAPILGPGQSAPSEWQTKAINTDPTSPSHAGAISGIVGWTYATPLANGTGSDHGLLRREMAFGRPPGGQSAFINNWDRMMSQTVAATFQAGDVLEASIDFGTLGNDGDPGRAGRFYLVAGQADPTDPDQFAAGSRILAELSVANPTWTDFTPDVVVGNAIYTRLNLSYTVQASDLAPGTPLTIAFKTVWGSFGPTIWDNASLAVRAVPEPSTLGLLALGGFGLLPFARRAARKTSNR
jgi:hypothetical protein